MNTSVLGRIDLVQRANTRLRSVSFQVNRHAALHGVERDRVERLVELLRTKDPEADALYYSSIAQFTETELRKLVRLLEPANELLDEIHQITGRREVS